MMYPVSNAFLQAIESNARSYYCVGVIITAYHVVYEFSITLFSSIYCYTLGGDTAFLPFDTYERSVESIPMDVFEVSEANRTIKCMELKAYDYMHGIVQKA